MKIPEDGRTLLASWRIKEEDRVTVKPFPVCLEPVQLGIRKVGNEPDVSIDRLVASEAWTIRT